jgi:dihydropteroate synthase
VNDVSGLRYDPSLGQVAAARRAVLVLMHTRGRSKTMYRDATYGDVAGEVVAELRESLARARDAGVHADRIVLDPGLGFAKRAEHSFRMLASLADVAALGRPLLVGPSRKSFLTLAAGTSAPPDRDWMTAGAVAASVLAGAHIVRVHNVAAMRDVVRVVDRVLAAASS